MRPPSASLSFVAAAVSLVEALDARADSGASPPAVTTESAAADASRGGR